MKKNQKMIIAGVVIALLVLVVGGAFAYKMSRGSAEVADENKPAEKKKRVNQYDTIPVEERPYLEVVPMASGRDVAITIYSLKKPAESVEYELEYQAGELQQAQFGTLELPTFPTVKEVLLGSRSAGGATTYHENVKGGTLVSRFMGTNTYAHKSDWRFIDNAAKEKVIASKDAKFQLESPEFAKQRYVIVTNSPGYPAELPGTPISSMYTVSFASTAPTGKATLTLRTNEDATDMTKIAIYDGKTWKTVTAKVDAASTKSLTAEVEMGKMYVALK